MIAHVLLGDRLAARRPGRPRPRPSRARPGCAARRRSRRRWVWCTRRRMPAVSTNRHVLAAELDQLVDRVAGGAGDLVDDDALLAGQLVEQAGLADVGPAEQRDAARAADRRRPSADRATRAARASDGVEQVAAAPAVQGRDRVGLAEPEDHSAAASASVRWSSTLLAASTTGLPARRSTLDDGLVGVGRRRPSRRRRTARRRPARSRPRPARRPGSCDALGVGLPAAGVDQR